MPDNTPQPEDPVRCVSDCDIIEVTEQNSVPGEPSERYRRYLEEKHGRKNPQNPPSGGPADGPERS